MVTIDRRQAIHAFGMSLAVTATGKLAAEAINACSPLPSMRSSKHLSSDLHKYVSDGLGETFANMIRGNATSSSILNASQ